MLLALITLDMMGRDEQIPRFQDAGLVFPVRKHRVRACGSELFRRSLIMLRGSALADSVARERASRAAEPQSIQENSQQRETAGD